MIDAREQTVPQEAVHRALEVLREAALGNLELRIHCIEEEGEAGELLRAINRLLDMTDEFTREAQACMESASRGIFHRRVMEWGMHGRFLAASRSLNVATEEMEKRDADLAEARNSQVKVANVMAQVVETFSHSASSLRKTAAGLIDVSIQSVASANAVAESSEQASENIQSIASTTEQLAASVQDIERMTRMSATTTSQALQSSQRAVETLTGLCDASRKVDLVVRTIGDVANQTRMLALNATIEAARAGEMGRGFSVVASEVKGLAHETSEATKKITEQIEGLQASSNDAATVVDQVGGCVTSLSQYSSEIAEAMEQQKIAAREMSKETCQAAERARTVYKEGLQVKALALETNRAAELVARESDSLTRQVQLLLTQAETLIANTGLTGQVGGPSQCKSVMDFDSAIQAHGAWKLKLSAYLRKPDGSLKSAEVEPDDRCALGKWIHGDGARWCDLPEFSVLKKEHARFHKAAASVVRKADSGQCTTEAIALGGESEFSVASAAVVRAITDMRWRTDSEQ